MNGKFRLTKTCLAISATLGLLISSAYAAEQPKEATSFTKSVNQQYQQTLPFNDRQDFEDAQRGFIAPLLNHGELKSPDGKVIYRAEDYKFDLNAPAPDTVNPSFWRQSQINGISGLFKVTDRMYQVRSRYLEYYLYRRGYGDYRR